MGLLTRLLTLPLEPVRGVAWVGEQLQSAAEREYYDEGRIRRELLELEEELEAGRITEDEYEAAEDELIDRLMHAQQLATDQAATDTAEAGAGEHNQAASPAAVTDRHER
jgi:hypothetical protein